MLSCLIKWAVCVAVVCAIDSLVHAFSRTGVVSGTVAARVCGFGGNGKLANVRELAIVSIPHRPLTHALQLIVDPAQSEAWPALRLFGLSDEVCSGPWSPCVLLGVDGGVPV